ncbi:hypothetical protein E3E31_12095 [Thermococcus sp. M39]|uniref:hypothetical protein n=1 Tax=Thermococcus sp. M39 TaxID=1638262 RepID=UPI00143BB437|nr:hypothetical protein [Thermococcus sp. M39]NJE09249.1 hypothetical protein [Thermococcus sp. M39]
MSFLRERLRKWLGVSEIGRDVERLQKDLLKLLNSQTEAISRLENVEERLAILETELKALRQELGSKIDEERFSSILNEINEIKKSISLVRTISFENAQSREFSSDEELKDAILSIISTGESVTISELQKLLNVSWGRLYKVISELEKEKKVKRRELKVKGVGKRVVVKPISD